MKKIMIVSATKHSSLDMDKILIGKSMKMFHDLSFISKSNYNIESNIEFNNTEALSKVYNKFIINDLKDYIVVFAHDDCIIEDAMLVDKLNEAMKKYDVVGLAGMKAPITIKEPALWHLMGDRNNASGAVAHFTGKDDNERFMTNFGITPARVALLDGVFLAINVDRCLETGVRFDESFPSRFHYYDLDFSLTANKAGLKLTTWPIWVTHKSHGLTKPDEEFYKGQEYFIKKWT
jgi:GT2 family glycosyltransferase